MKQERLSSLSNTNSLTSQFTGFILIGRDGSIF